MSEKVNGSGPAVVIDGGRTEARGLADLALCIVAVGNIVGELALKCDGLEDVELADAYRALERELAVTQQRIADTRHWANNCAMEIYLRTLRT